MSRRRSFLYFIGPRHEIPVELWDALYCDAKRCSRRQPIPCAYLDGGSTDQYGYTVGLSVTRAKARRLKTILDDHFGREGQLLDVTDWDYSFPYEHYPWEIEPFPWETDESGDY